MSPADVLPLIPRARAGRSATTTGCRRRSWPPTGGSWGWSAAHSIDWANRKSSIGYWLARDEQGHGTMTEAVRAHVDSAFATWGLNGILIQAAVENARSRAIPERLGFREEGTGCARSSASGDRMLDGVVYAMLAADWPGG